MCEKHSGTENSSKYVMILERGKREVMVGNS
jgi:hypothetical protein